MNNLAHGETADRMSGAAVNLILKVADTIGIDVQPILHSMGLPPLVRNGLDVALAGTPSSTQLALAFQVLVAALCAHSSQRGAADSPTKADVDLFCSCLINCDTLDVVVERAIRFTRISNNRWGEISLAREGAQTAFFMDSQRQQSSAATAALDMFGLVFFYKLFSWLIADPLALIHVQMTNDHCINEHVAVDIFNCPVVFGSSRTALVFNSIMLDKPVVRTYRDLIWVLERQPIALLVLPPRVSVRNRIEMIFRRAINAQMAVPKLEGVASMLGQSVSTLRRNLLRENTSFQAIMDCLRMQHSLVLLRDTALTVDDISTMLGFSAPSAFSRAFKGWTGHPPSVYRMALGE
jgi:AraC-like DNA-binding protein